jgi:hypothetical protein
MAIPVIPEPQRTYLLELLAALGAAADDFVIAGAQAMKFTVEKARGTKDVDFILNVVALRKEPLQLAKVLEGLGYKPVPESRNFQFAKDIPGTKETMRIEFMAPEEFKRRSDFRVEIQDGVHARACTGGSIALEESDIHTISGKLPNGTLHTAKVRVTRSHALVMLKLLALSDRYNNIRGTKEARHDREEAQTHAADIVALLTAVSDIPRFNDQFVRQFRHDTHLGLHVLSILQRFFRDATSPGLLVYSEHVAASLSQGRETSETIQTEVGRAQTLVARICPPPEFFALAAAIDDSTGSSQMTPLVDDFLATLEGARIPPFDPLALQSLPSGAFGGAYAPGTTLVRSAPELMGKLSEAERVLLQDYLRFRITALGAHESLRTKYPHTLAR